MSKFCFCIPQPLRVCMLGPPASGKTTVVKQLCDHYKLHHIKIKDVVDEAIENLVRDDFMIYLYFFLFWSPVA